MSGHQEVLEQLRGQTRELRMTIPGVWDGFLALHNAAMADGVVSARLKEAAALAISVVKQCDACIDDHAKAAARVGTTPEEVAEMLGVAVLMDGATATVYAPRAWEAFVEFTESQDLERRAEFAMAGPLWAD